MGLTWDPTFHPGNFWRSYGTQTFFVDRGERGPLCWDFLWFFSICVFSDFLLDSLIKKSDFWATTSNSKPNFKKKHHAAGYKVDDDMFENAILEG